jgi:glycopeptide antibiotics resistance protein
MSNVSTLIHMVEKSIFSADSVSSVSMVQVVAVAAAAYLVCLAFFFRKNRPGKNVALALLFLYAGVLFALTVPVVPPARWRMSSAATDWALHSILWAPFVSASSLWKNACVSGNWVEFLRLVGGNLLVFLPLGILVPIVNPHFRFGKMLLLAILVPVCIEAMQLAGNILAATQLRTVETEDVILNALGCIVGYLLFALVRCLASPRHRARHYR